MSKRARNMQASTQPACLMGPAMCCPHQAQQGLPSSSSVQLQVRHVAGSAGDCGMACCGNLSAVVM